MKKFTLLAVMVSMVGVSLWAQRPNRVLSADQAAKVHTYAPIYEQQTAPVDNHGLLEARPYVESPLSTAKTSGIQAVSPRQMGRASNVYSILRTAQNQVYANDSLNVVAFIHRHDVTIWGGGGAESGKLRYDLSIDGGSSFVSDLGPLNNAYQRPSRYPNITGFNNSGTPNPFASQLVYSAPTLSPSPDWDGYVTGMSTVDLSAPVVTETYSLLNANTLLQGGLTQSTAGVYWTADFRYNGATTGEIFVNRGEYNAQAGDVVWQRKDTIVPNHFTGANSGSPVLIGPNIAFSPDGMTGWVAYLGDIVGGHDSTVQAIFIKSTDAGATWGAPMEVDLRTIPWIEDSLQSLWITVDSVSGDTSPASSGIPTLAFDFDLTVDINGNPHMAAVVGTAGAGQPYSIGSGLAKFLGDIWTPDGGATWTATYIAPILAFRGDFGTGDPVSMDNQPQISRTPTGDHIFYSWADSDTSAATGSMNGIGFGNSDQLAPNLRIAGLRVSDGAQTCYKRVTDGDFIWEGRALFPTLAPEVLISGDSVYLPIVMVEMIANDPLQPCQFWYFGMDANFDASVDFGNIVNLAWDANCTPIVNVKDEVVSEIVLGQSFPNPTNDKAVIEYAMPYSANVTIDLVNVYGQQVGILQQGEVTAGTHRVDVSTRELAAGVYFYNLRTQDQTLTRKMIVTK